MLGTIIGRQIRDRREVALFVATVTGVSVGAAVALDVVMQLFVLGHPIGEAVVSWIGTCVIAILIAVPVSRTVGLAHLRVHHAQLDVYRQSRTDELTGLANRRVFTEVLEGAREAGFVVAIADIDRFKRINDNYGHGVGDVVIQAIAQRLSAVAGAPYRVCRIGGEEFAVIGPPSDPLAAFELMERARREVSATPVTTLKGDVYVTVSFGVTIAEPGCDTDAACARADSALYDAKNAGRNRVHLDTDGLKLETMPDPGFDVAWADASDAGGAAAHGAPLRAA